MQPNDLETVTTHEPTTQTDTCERQPYEPPCLVQMDVAKTLGSTGPISDGITTS
ncbi:hypothetical protein SAMN05878276_2196 [Aquipseudomonas alcaligenes]|uniref:hypothetical protein n=1 Tax=Aquipseudomonas alcaligenes TaxID=43263 RepID=UPI000956D06D|nr:hypothetical protein [Pseudomonas alcaligenes]SIS09310.1 hypothetical protein SAMN05878276_2196 [Pseudomonas alcaligenes]